MIPSESLGWGKDEMRQYRPRKQNDAWHLLSTQYIQLFGYHHHATERCGPGKEERGKGHRTTHMGTWVPTVVALSRNDVAGMNVVT